MSRGYRYETKFVLDNAKLSDAMNWLYFHTSATEKYNKRIVNSIYFDDVSFSSVRDNLAGISLRKKIRLRWYNNGESCSPVLEVKTRNGRLGNKFSYPIESIKGDISNYKLSEITPIIVNDLLLKNIILNEFIVPTLYVNYEREYYETYDGIRITIDNDIHFLDLQKEEAIETKWLFSYPYKVMEIKFNPSQKASVSSLIKPLNMSPKRHSKYLIGLSMFGYAVYI